jgi:hypothetical protein
MENQPQVVDIDIKALIEKAKTEQEAQKQPEVTADDVLKKLSLEDKEETTTEKKEGVSKIETEEVKEKTEPAPKKLPKNQYRDKLKSLIEDGLIENFQVTIGEEGKEVQTSLSELEDVDKDTYAYILATYKELKEKDLKEKYISKEGIDELTESLIELKQAGGDISSLIKEELQTVDILQQMKKNIDDEQQQIDIVYHELKGKGLSDRVIQAQINDLTENFELEKTATEILDTHIEAYKQSVETKKKEQLERIAEEKEKEKQFKKEVSTFYKESKIPENIRGLLIENTTKRDNQGLTNTDKLYFDSINDPQKHAKVAFMLHNLDEFEKWISAGKVLQNQTKTASSIMRIDPTVVKQDVNKGTGNAQLDNIYTKLKLQP